MQARACSESDGLPHGRTRDLVRPVTAACSAAASAGGDKPVLLGSRAFDILAALVELPGEVVAKRTATTIRDRRLSARFVWSDGVGTKRDAKAAGQTGLKAGTAVLRPDFGRSFDSKDRRSIASKIDFDTPSPTSKRHRAAGDDQSRA